MKTVIPKCNIEWCDFGNENFMRYNFCHEKHKCQRSKHKEDNHICLCGE